MQEICGTSSLSTGEHSSDHIKCTEHDFHSYCPVTDITAFVTTLLKSVAYVPLVIYSVTDT